MPVVETRHTFRSTVHYLMKEEEGKTKGERDGGNRERERDKRNDS